jgi:hypothetical protein
MGANLNDIKTLDLDSPSQTPPQPSSTALQNDWKEHGLSRPTIHSALMKFKDIQKTMYNPKLGYVVICSSCNKQRIFIQYYSKRSDSRLEVIVNHGKPESFSTYVELINILKKYLQTNKI